MDIAIVECFDHDYYIRGRLVDHGKHYKLKFQGKQKQSLMNQFVSNHSEYLFCDEEKTNGEPPYGHHCWCSAMTDFLLSQGFVPDFSQHAHGLHFFVRNKDHSE